MRLTVAHKIRDDHGRHRAAGFTLMELLVVIAIMAIISTVAIGSYFGLTRAAAYSAAHDTVYNTIALARQRAVIDGRTTSFIVLNATNYVVVRASGRITYASSDNVMDAYSDLSGALSVTADKVDLYNLDATAANAGHSRQVTIEPATISLVDPTMAANDPNRFYNIRGYNFAGAGNDFFQIGDRYGFALHTRQALPRGFVFTVSPREVRFANDGSCIEIVEITIHEAIKPANVIKLKVDKMGEISDLSLVKK